MGRACRLRYMQRGVQENLWPKFFLERPVARHFVCSLCMHTACRSLTDSKHRDRLKMPL
jgi:hypothetical protein